MNDTPIAEQTWFCFKIRHENGHFMHPRSDPYAFENPMDFLFESEEDAMRFLADDEAFEEAVADGWILVKETLTPIKAIDAAMIPEDQPA